jgi:hypothetical protein
VLDPRIPDGFAQVHAAYDLDDVAHAITLIEQLDGIEKRRAAKAGQRG